MPEFESTLNPREIGMMHKIVRLAQKYPKDTIGQLRKVFQCTDMEFNAATWRARDAGYLEINKSDHQHYKVLKTPEEWKFGEEVDQLKRDIVYLLEVEARKELDMLEDILRIWVAGYYQEDYLTAVNSLVDEKKIEYYSVYSKPEDSTYIFYTLTGNAAKRWGEKQFKDQKQLSDKKEAK